MKIQGTKLSTPQDLRPTKQGGPSASSSAKSDKLSFSEIMARDAEKKVYNRLNQIMQKVDEQGKALSEKQTVAELKKYKKLVKLFMDEAVNAGLELKEDRHFTRRGRTQLYKMIRQVDDQLVKLTQDVVDKQAPSLDILDRVGEIKGLLVNMYT